MNRNGIPVQDESPTNVEEVLLTLFSKTEILVLDTVEHEFLSSGDQPMLLFTFRLAQIFTCGLVLGTNVPMIIFTLNQGSKTFLDWLIIFDCFLCLGNLHVLIILIRLSDDDIGFCVFHVFLMFFFNLCNRLLTLGIAIYRFTLVLGSSLVFTTYQKKVLEIFIPLFILVISILLTGWAIYYREDYRHFLGETENCAVEIEPFPYLVCSGKIHQFFYNFSDFYKLKTIGSPQWSLSKTNPFHIATLISFCSSMVVTPVCYAAIYRYLYSSRSHNLCPFVRPVLFGPELSIYTSFWLRSL